MVQPRYIVLPSLGSLPVVYDKVAERSIEGGRRFQPQRAREVAAELNAATASLASDALISIEGETCTWAEFQAANADGYDRSEFDEIGGALAAHGSWGQYVVGGGAFAEFIITLV